MTESNATAVTTAPSTTAVQVHRVFIKASRQAVWDAITQPEWNARYGYAAPSHYDLRPGGVYRVLASKEMLDMGASEVIVDGEVLEADPPHRLVQTWRALFDETTTAEGFTRLTWELEDQHGVTRLTVTHEVTGAPSVATQVAGDNPDAGGGWPWILSDLKSLLETGKTMQMG